MKSFFLYLLFALLLNGCGGGTYQDPERYDSQLTEMMKKHALRGFDYHAVVHSSSSYESPYVYSHTSFEKAKKDGLNNCSRKYKNCYVYKLKYLGHDPHVGFIYDEVSEKILKTKKQKKLKSKSTTNIETKSESPKKELSFKEIMASYFGSRDLDDIEGLWGYRRDNEKEARIYLMIKSDNYLYKEIVIYHPVRKFEGEISTRLIKKINNNSYKTKATWLNDGEVDERDGTIKIIDKFKLKFETDRHCYSSEKECLKAGTFYKKKIWPSKTYADDAKLTQDQVETLKDLLD